MIISESQVLELQRKFYCRYMNDYEVLSEYEAFVYIHKMPVCANPYNRKIYEEYLSILFDYLNNKLSICI